MLRHTIALFVTALPVILLVVGAVLLVARAQRPPQAPSPQAVGPQWPPPPAARRTGVEAGLFWGGVLALAVGVVTLFLALAMPLVSLGGSRSSMAAVYLGFGVGGLTVAGLLGLAHRAVVLRDRNPVVCRITAEWQGSFTGRRRCVTHGVVWDEDGPCPEGSVLGAGALSSEYRLTGG